MKSLVEKRYRLPVGLFICFFISHEELDVLRKEAAKRSLTSVREDFSFLESAGTGTQPRGWGLWAAVPVPVCGSAKCRGFHRSLEP